MSRRTNRSVDESIVRMSGRPNYLGVIAFGSASKNNHTTAAPFNDTGQGLMGKIILLQPDAAVYVLPVLTNSSVVTATNGVLLAANERVIMTFGDPDTTLAAGEFHGWLAAIRSVGDGNLRVWELL